MAVSLNDFDEARRQFVSHDRRMVAGAFGQLTLWPDSWVHKGWEKRDVIREAPWAYVGGVERG